MNLRVEGLPLGFNRLGPGLRDGALKAADRAAQPVEQNPLRANALGGLDGAAQVVEDGQKRRDEVGLLARDALVRRAREALAQLVRLALEFSPHLLEARLHVRRLLLGGARASLKLLDEGGLEARPALAGLRLAAFARVAAQVDAPAVVDANPTGRLLRLQFLRPVAVSRLPLRHIPLLVLPAEKFHPREP